MLPMDVGGGADVKVGLDALKTFKKRVDDLLATFEGSPGSSAKVAAHTLTEASFGTGNFGEATGLHGQYQRVHERITTLSKTLGLQIEALQIAVHATDVGFDKLEEHLRYRFWEIRAEMDRQKTEVQSDQKRSDNKQSTTGY